MAGLVNAIPLDLGTDDDGAFPFALPTAVGRGGRETEASGSRSATAMGQLGLLAVPRPVVAEADRRIEDWIACQLDLSMAVEDRGAPRTVWDRLVGKLPVARRKAGARPARGGPETAFADWSRFRIAYRRGVTVVRLIDRALVKERDVKELTRDLIELIDAGNHRVLISFHGIERAASWVALAVDEAFRRARSRTGDGGELKVCGLSPSLASILDLAGMAPGIELHPDEESALNATWPEPSSPRALPVDLLTALMSGPELPPVCGGAPSEASSSAAATSASPGRRRGSRRSAEGLNAARGEPGVWLVVRMGGSKGRPVPVHGPRFVIGRQPDCQLRLGSPLVSKLHAAIERRDGRTFLVDLGSTNGTVLNGRPLRGKEAEIHDGDRIQVGPAVCTVATVAHRDDKARVEKHVAGWLHGDGPADPGAALDTAVIATSTPAHDDDAEADDELCIRSEIIQDVLVVTPELGELESEATIERLRTHLYELFAQPVPRRVVVNLEYVAHLTGQAIGVLLAHHLRLDRSGGALRICQARARIMAVLHQVRLTMLVECHPTLDEAVLAAWPSESR
ncbi:MAG: FHA domain-containing protein [Isosphaeraceae bacterium]